MIVADETVFPNNVVKWVSLAMGTIDPDVTILKRTLRNTDPAVSIGVSAMAWTPIEESLEMGHPTKPNLRQPTLSQYTFAVQSFVRAADEVEGLAMHATLSNAVRAVLYTNPELQVVLGKLRADLPAGVVESMRRWGIRTVRYFGNEIDGKYLYLSTLEFFVETETTS